ncbi:SMI1/KNR4 family protein [Streptomyces sp. NPDC019531]|uniref:SMI1/KNR4 family protein n=1 Tax=Streptomyces sp. NPDC019531 TaxID=3365062 RepID=UPI00384E9AD9
MATGTPGLTELWQCFEDWLGAHAPGDHATLRPGCSDGEIRRLEDGLGFLVHEDVRVTLGLHNGVVMRRASTEAGAFLLGYSLLDVDGILQAHRDLVSMVEDAREEDEEDLVIGRIADPLWVPLARNISGDLLFVDHRLHHSGEIGEMSFGDPEYRLLWPRMDLMLADLYDALEKRTPVTSVPRVPRLHEERMLEWPVQTRQP